MSLQETRAYPSRSIWAAHSTMKRELQRHSVEKDVKGFCGWPIMQKITESAKSVGADPLRDSGFIAASFSTGGKVSEVLALTPSMFSVVKGCKPWLWW